MADTDLTVLSNMEYQLLEVQNGGTALTTSMWSGLSEWLDALNLAQSEFLLKTGCIIKRTTIGATPGIDLYALPSDYLAMVRLAWSYTDGSGKARIRVITVTDEFELDNGVSNWPFSYDLPAFATITETPTLKFKVAKAPSDVGSFILHYVPKGAVLDGSGIPLAVPTGAEQFIRYGAMGVLLSKNEFAADPQRAEYCKMRYEMGIELMGLLLGG